MLACLFQQAARAFNIGAQKRPGIFDRPIDVRFSGEVHDGFDSMLLEYVLDLSFVRDIASNKLVLRISCDFLNVS